jgi:hypothetical protein|nr:MAG TPA: hypothetical protein [Caudoviricetes sp.]
MKKEKETVTDILDEFTQEIVNWSNTFRVKRFREAISPIMYLIEDDEDNKVLSTVSKNKMLINLYFLETVVNDYNEDNIKIIIDKIEAVFSYLLPKKIIIYRKALPEILNLFELKKEDVRGLILKEEYENKLLRDNCYKVFTSFDTIFSRLYLEPSWKDAKNNFNEIKKLIQTISIDDAKDTFVSICQKVSNILFYTGHTISYHLLNFEIKLREIITEYE